jgi:hypothetical protein
VAPLTSHSDPEVRAEAASYLAERGASRHADRLRTLMETRPSRPPPRPSLRTAS